MFLIIFVASAEDVVVPTAATKSKRGGCISYYSPAGVFPTAASSIFRSENIWG